MNVIDVQQGSEEWKKLREEYYCASEAPAMMGESQYMTRDELLHIKKTGEVKPVSNTLQAIFDEGHRVEALARAILEEEHDLEYPPIVCVDTVEGLPLLASFDGLGLEAFEHKLANDDLLMKTVCGEIEPTHYWQLEQQLLISGVGGVYFVVSDGTSENRATCFYASIQDRRKRLIAGWKQFQIDLDNYEPKEKREKIVAKEIEAFPKLEIVVSGNVENSNLPVFQSEAEKYIRAIKTNLETDQDFADADKAVKFLSAMEKSLDESKQRAIDGAADIREVYKVIDNLKALSRSKRLDLDKLVKFQKQEIRDRIITRSVSDFSDFLKDQKTEPAIIANKFDPASAMKGKKTIESLENTASTALANAKVEATEQANLIRKNLEAYNSEFEEYGFLFKDLAPLLHKQNEDFISCSKVRIADYKEKQLQIKEAEEKRKQEKEARELEAAKNKPEALPENKTEKEEIKIDTPSPGQHVDNVEVSKTGRPQQSNPLIRVKRPEDQIINCPHCKKTFYHPPQYI